MTNNAIETIRCDLGDKASEICVLRSLLRPPANAIS